MLDHFHGSIKEVHTPQTPSPPYSCVHLSSIAAGVSGVPADGRDGECSPGGGGGEESPGAEAQGPGGEASRALPGEEPSNTVPFRNGRNLELCSMFVRSTATWRTRAGSGCRGASSATPARRTASPAPRASATTSSASAAATPSSSRAAAAPPLANSAYASTNRQKNATQPRLCLRRVGVFAGSKRSFRTSSRRACLRSTPSSTARSALRESYPWSTTVRTNWPLVRRGKSVTIHVFGQATKRRRTRGAGRLITRRRRGLPPPAGGQRRPAIRR